MGIWTKFLKYWEICGLTISNVTVAIIYALHFDVIYEITCFWTDYIWISIFIVAITFILFILVIIYTAIWWFAYPSIILWAILVWLSRLNNRCLIRTCFRRRITLKNLIFVSKNMIILYGLTSKSEPFTISINCLHFSINSRFLLFSKSPGYDRNVCSIAWPILPDITNFNISGKYWK